MQEEGFRGERTHKHDATRSRAPQCTVDSRTATRTPLSLFVRLGLNGSNATTNIISVVSSRVSRLPILYVNHKPRKRHQEPRHGVVDRSYEFRFESIQSTHKQRASSASVSSSVGLSVALFVCGLNAARCVCMLKREQFYAISSERAFERKVK